MFGNIRLYVFYLIIIQLFNEILYSYLTAIYTLKWRRWYDVCLLCCIVTSIMTSQWALAWILPTYDVLTTSYVNLAVKSIIGSIPRTGALNFWLSVSVHYLLRDAILCEDKDDTMNIFATGKHKVNSHMPAKHHWTKHFS